MRIVNNTGTSLLDFLNNDVSVQDVLNKGVTGSKLSAGAKKTLEQHGITLGSASNAVSKDTTEYSNIKTTTEALRDTIIQLTDKDSDSILNKAEESGDTKDAVTLTKDFAKQYNEMLIAMKAMGGTGNTKYTSELTALVDANADALKAVGITKQENGLLKVDEETLNAASAKDIKAAFAGTSEFAEKVAQKSIYIEANAISAMYSSTVSNYGNSGAYTDSTMSSFLQSI